jgi:glutamyl-tRNA synthetase
MTVRVRFAPSPTGFIHVGNVRAALMNWLFARQQGGEFILRLDDTDVERSTEEYADAIMEDLLWLGLDWDESFKQSERFERYNEVVEKLKADGRLYPCYETANELDRKRKVQLSRHMPPVYDREGLTLTDDQKATFEAEGRTAHWRFKLTTPARIDFDDLIRGNVSIDMESVSDPILIRGDGSFLYTLPSVVDDIDMRISHVVRGEDHVTNSAVQVDIFRALGAEAPEFAHFSLLTSVDGGGLSKRKGSLAIQDLRDEEGLECMSIISLLGRMGTSDPIEPFAEMDPLVESFDFSKYAKKPSKFDTKELLHLNAKIVHDLDYETVKNRTSLEGLDEVFWNTVRPNITILKDVKDWLAIVEGPVTPKIDDRTFMTIALSMFPDEDITNETWREWTHAVKKETGNKGKALFMPLRLAITGQDHGPEMGTLLPLIGAERIKARLKGNVA